MRALPLVLLLGLAACNKPIDSEPKKDDLPALAKVEEAKAPNEQGDATKPGRLQKPEPVADTSTVNDGAPPSDDHASDAADDPPSEPRPTSKHKRPAHEDSASSDDGGDDDADKATTPTHLAIKRIQFAEAIDKREPVSPEETFSAKQTEKLYAFVELDNPEKARGRVFVHFIPPLGSTSKVELRVGDKSRWRTWALRRSVKAVGTWTVVVKDAKGNELGRRTFEVTE
ncbi:MAG: DUF2914 domain-containing protein [Polyangiaceae bacterium]